MMSHEVTKSLFQRTVHFLYDASYSCLAVETYFHDLQINMRGAVPYWLGNVKRMIVLQNHFILHFILGLHLILSLRIYLRKSYST